jgi:hypothetical protein
MSTSPAQDLADAFYSLRELEFFQPHQKFPAERELVRLLVERAQKLGDGEFHAFSRELIRTISSYCHSGARSQDVLYRAFDGIDDVLEIDYQETRQMMPKTGASERLYEGGGVGVQTSYSTILKVLEHLQLKENAHLIDLGSGFGRVGLATGLWREDLRFSGYEYVGHRVAASNASANRAGVGERVRFMQQDLSTFQIPAADVYYLYDPFSASTYHQVFARLSELGRERATTVVAKAGARESFQRSMDAHEWLPPETLDEGTIFLYRSR